MDKKFKRNIPLEYLNTFIRNSNVTHGIWLLYLAFKGFTLFEIGIVEGVFHLTSLTMEVPTGIIADIYGRKLSRALGILSYLVYALLIVFSSNFGLIIIAFIFCGLSYTLESGAGDAMVYDSLKGNNEEDKFMKVMGYKEAIYQGSAALALFIGGYIAMISFELSYAIAIIISLFSLLTIMFMKETLEVVNPEKKTIKQLMYDQYILSFKVIKKNKRLFYLIIIISSVTAPSTALFLYFQNHLEAMDYSTGMIGIILGLNSVFSVAGGLVAYFLEKKYKEKKILYFVPLLMTLSFWLIQFDSTAIFAFILIGFFDSVFYIVMLDYINNQTPTKTRATVLSLIGMMFSIVMIIIFPVIGLLAEIINLKFGFLIMTIMVSLFNIFLLVILKGNHLKKVEN